MTNRTPDTITLSQNAKCVGRQFVLYRYKDVSGISGEGVVAEGVEFANGQAVLKWHPKTSNIRKRDVRNRTKNKDFMFHGSISVFQSVDEIIEIHGHKGNSEVLYLDEIAGVQDKNKLYEPPWSDEDIIKDFRKKVKAASKDEASFNKAVGRMVAAVRIAERKSYRRGWNDAVMKNKIGIDA